MRDRISLALLLPAAGCLGPVFSGVVGPFLIEAVACFGSDGLGVDAHGFPADRVPFLHHGGDTIRLLLGEVVEFGAINRDVVELPWLAFQGNDFPVGTVVGAGSVVGEENDEGVVEFARRFEIGDDAAGLLVDAVDERGLGGHAAGFPILELGRE